MSEFFSSRFSSLTPYVPGEQPVGVEEYIKLNTNESPFGPSERTLRVAHERLRPLQLYPDPEYSELRCALGQQLGMDPARIIVTNGSDEVLYFAFLAFCDAGAPAVFPDVTYGFYTVFSQMAHVEQRIIPLTDDLDIDPAAYAGVPGTVFIANPNAPTGKLLSVEQIESIVAADEGRVVVIDEAYIDFGGESCIELVERYRNLLVTRTFSKSRSMAGCRLGFGIAQEGLIGDLNTLRNSLNPYNVNSATVALGLGSLADDEAFRAGCENICRTREFVTAGLRKLGFEVLDSFGNFVFARTPRMAGGELYAALKERGILVRHFDAARICDYNRISIGTREQMETLLNTLESILEGR